MNHSQSESQPRPYSRNYPPKTQADAHERIDALRTDITEIETKLDHADPDTYCSDDAYASWRRRATAALTHKKTELGYLKGWLTDQQTAEKRATTARQSANLSDIVTQIKGRAQELADEIGRGYHPCYTKESPPDNIPAALERLDDLVAIKTQLQNAFSEITAAWVSYPLRRDGLLVPKRPLQAINCKVEKEIVVIRGYLRDGKDEKNWAGVCAKALARAVHEGFVLTSEEIDALEGLMKRLGLS